MRRNRRFLLIRLSRRWNSTPRPATYEAAALPAELRRHKWLAKSRVRRAPSRALRLASKVMRTLDVERLAAGDYNLIKPLLIELHLAEQVHYSDHPQLSRGDIEDHLTEVPAAFRGENVIFAVRDEIGQVAGFCWIVLYDPGTGLEGEVAEVYVAA